jgi:hypothetical protein
MMIVGGGESLALAAREWGIEHQVMGGVGHLGLDLSPDLFHLVHPALRQQWLARSQAPRR